MIQAYALIRCDAPGCIVAIALPDPLSHGQLNPLQCGELREAAESAGWHGCWGYREGSPTTLHYCPTHAPESAREG